jgi:hypothetical protein
MIMNKAKRKRYYDTTEVEQPYPDDSATTEQKRRSEHATAPAEGPDDPEFTGALRKEQRPRP